MVSHFDGHAVVAATGQKPDAVGHFGGGYCFGKGIDQCRNFNCGCGVDSNSGHVQVQDFITPHFLADLQRKLHAVKIFVVLVPSGGGGVAHHRVRLHRINPLHQVVLVEVSGGCEQPGLGERDCSHRAAIYFHHFGGSSVFQGGLDHAVG